MPHPKIRVCTEAEKRKAEMFNKIDDLIQTGEVNEALDYLHYLHRNAPSVRAHVQRKLAQCYYELKNFQKCLTYLQDLIPTSDTFINKMVIENLLKLNKKDHALFHLARTPISPTKKRELFFLIFPGLQEEYTLSKMDSILKCLFAVLNVLNFYFLLTTSQAVYSVIIPSNCLKLSILGPDEYEYYQRKNCEFSEEAEFNPK